MGLDFVELVFRWMHVLAAIVAVGGTIYQRFMVLPALGELPAAERARVADAIRGRWAMWVRAAITFLLISGLYNFLFVVNKRYDLPPLYHALFGIKFLLALVIFTLASFLTGRSGVAQRFVAAARFWLTVNLVLALAVVGISGVLRGLPKQPKTVEPPAAVSPDGPAPAGAAPTATGS